MTGLRWIPIGSASDLRAHAPTTIVVDQLEIALFEHDGALRALENSCPHAGGPLADGIVARGAVECLWHGWAFDLSTGACRSGPSRPVRTFAVREVGGVVELGLAPTG